MRRSLIMKTMKKVLAVIMTLMMILALAACGGGASEESTDESASSGETKRVCFVARASADGRVNDEVTEDSHPYIFVDV